MSRIFLSHSSKDLFEAIALHRWLAAEGWDDVFLDTDPARGIAAGERWERALHQAAQRCEAVVFLLSRNWLASGWCRKEYELARSLNKQLFGVIIDSAISISEAAPELTGTWQVVKLTPGQDGQVFSVKPDGSHEERHVTFGTDGLRRLKHGLEKAGLDPKYFAWPPESEPGRAPYRGLKPLEKEDAGIFFGRDAPIVEATDRLRELAAAAPPRLSVILGASGAGKSSFLRAGLLPRLQRDDAHFLPLPPIRPERAALHGESGLIHALEAVLPGRSRAEWRRLVGEGASTIRPLLAGLAQAAFQRTLAEEQAAKPPAIVIAIDQTEELFRPAGAEEGAALLALLRDLTSGDLATGDDPAFIAIFAIRSDSYDALEHAKALEGLRQVPLALLPMPRGAYKDVIEGPARRLADAGGRLAIEPHLTQRLLEDIEKGGGSDALPLLAFTLEQLFLEYGGAGALRLADYEAFGGLRGAIDAAVERAFARADADPRIPRDRAERETLLRRGLVPWLAGIDPVSKSPRRNIARARDIPPEAAPLIEFLVEERLLSTDTRPETDPATGAEVRVKTIEPTHEALLRQWGLLQGWLAADFGLLVTLEAVNRASRDWDANARDDAWLAHQGQRLADAQALDARPDIARKLDAVDRSYLAACTAKKEASRAEAEQRRQEKEAEEARKLADAQALAAANQRTARRTRIGFFTSLLLALFVGLFGVKANHLRVESDKRAEDLYISNNRVKKQLEEAQINQSSYLVATAKSLQKDDPDLSIALVLSALPSNLLRPERAFFPEAMTELYKTETLYHCVGVLTGQDLVWTAKFSPDGTKVITAARDGTSKVYDVFTGAVIFTLKHDKTVRYANFDATGTKILTVADDGIARVWDAKTGELMLALKADQGQIEAAEFSPDGARILTGLSSGFAVVRNSQTGKIVATGPQVIGRADVMSFSPDGRSIAHASRSMEPGDALVWDAESGKTMLKLHADAGVRSLSFSRDSRKLLTGAEDGTSAIWNLDQKTVPVKLEAHRDEILSVAFSTSGKQVATSAADGTARLWDAETGQLIWTFGSTRPNLNINTVRFSPDDTTIVTSSLAGVAEVWSTVTGERIATLKGHDDRGYSNEVVAAEFNSKGNLIVTASADGTARLWSVPAKAKAPTVVGYAKKIAYNAIKDELFLIEEGGVSVRRLASIEAKPTDFKVDGLEGVLTDSSSLLVLTQVKSVAHILKLPSRANVSQLKLRHDYEIYDSRFSIDGRKLATVSMDGEVSFWDVATGSRLWTKKVSNSITTYPKFLLSPDGTRVLAVDESGSAFLVDAIRGSLISTIRHVADGVTATAFSHSSSYILLGYGNGAIEYRESRTGALVRQFSGHTMKIHSLEFGQGDTLAISGSHDETARIWRLIDGWQVAKLEGHNEPIQGAHFAKANDRAVTLSGYKIKVWDVPSGVELFSLKGGDTLFDSAYLSEDGSSLAIQYEDGKVEETQIFVSPANDWLSAMKIRSMHILTPQERQQYNINQFFRNGFSNEVSDGTACDAYGGNPFDPSVLVINMEGEGGFDAVSACRRAQQTSPKNLRYTYNLGRLLLENPDRRGGLAALEKAAEGGYPAAFDELAKIYAKSSTAGDHAKAIAFYERAAKRGFALSLSSLGNLLWEGQIVKQDKARAVALWQEAAEKVDEPFSHLWLAYLSEEGRDGYPKDLSNALLHYIIANRIVENRQASVSTSWTFAHERAATLAANMAPELVTKMSLAAYEYIEKRRDHGS